MENTNKRTLINNICKVLSIVSLALTAIFFVYLINLNMLPIKYFLRLLIIITILYTLFLLFIIPKNIKLGFKISSTILMFIISLILFLVGFVYIDKAIDFIDKIDNSIVQKENYNLLVLNTSHKTSIEELNNGIIGVYNSNLGLGNLDKALNLLGKKISFKQNKYDDLKLMLEDLTNKVIDAVLINDSVISIIESDLSYLNISMKKIDTIAILVEQADIAKYVDVTNTPFNIYIAGSDSYGSIDKITNTDVNMVVTVDPVGHKLLLTSIPRDYYVKIPGLNGMDKITHAGYYGIQTSVETVENLLDIEINYYAKVNFSTVKEVVDAIGGITVYNEFSFCMVESPEVCFKSGNIHLDGYRALMYARERKTFSTGDVQRVKNQQKVLSAVVKKITTSSSIITNYAEILDSISNNFTTNMEYDSISNLVKKQLNDMKGWTITSQNLTGHDLYTTETYSYPGMSLYVMQQDEQSINEAKQKIKEVMN
ncbi:MAG: LytR family transcriptional regulator [Firmicutes bacterium]|nr:LytR family transcriptional regulator [Bacillota bacterium]